MSEETQDHNDGTFSGLKKTIIGTLTTIITGGGVWLSTHLFGGEATDKEEVKTEVAAPTQAQPAAPVIINLQNNNTNQQKQSSSPTTIVKERVIEKAAPVQQTPAQQTPPAQKESW